MRLPLAWIVSMRLGKAVYKSSTGIRCHYLWLSSHNYSSLRRFFWRILFFSSIHIFSMIFESGLWKDQSFIKVTSSSAKLLFHVICGMKLRYAKKSHLHPNLIIKFSISKWMYLTLFFLPSILTNFLEPLLFTNPKASDSFPQTSLSLSCNVGRFAFLEAFWQIFAY